MRAKFIAAVLLLLLRVSGLLTISSLVVGASGCRRASDLETPEQVVMALVDRMQRIHGDPERSLEAFELMSRSTQENLNERARRASAAAGRIVRPEEMIGPSRFFLEFPAVRFTARRGRDWAVVTVEGVTAEMRREIRCRQEEGQWKVEIDLPPLAPQEKSIR